MLSRAADAGQASWGMALTLAEVEQLDVQRRMDFAGEAFESLLPFARAQRNFAGVYSPGGGGRRDSVQRSESNWNEIRAARAATCWRRGRTRGSARVRMFETGRSDGRSEWPKVFDEITFHSAGIDVVTNQLRIEVDRNVLDVVSANIGELREALGVPITVIEGSAPSLLRRSAVLGRPVMGQWKPEHG